MRPAKYIIPIVVLLLLAVAARVFGPREGWAITIPIRGDNTYYAIFLKDAIFWVLVLIAIAVAIVYAWRRTHASP
jgi:hypothetical protein